MTASAAIAAPASQNPWRRRLSAVQDATLVVVAAFFVYAHGGRVMDGELTSLIFAAEQSLLVGMFLFRRRSRATSTSVADWTVAAIGGWLPLALRPADASSTELAAAGVTIQAVGACFTIVAFADLGRSFGVVAANRGLKVNGPYRLVRHPIYATHMVTTAGFLLANASPVNVALVAVITLAQIARINAEERLLTATTNYSDYKARVRWRLLPGVY